MKNAPSDAGIDRIISASANLRDLLAFINETRPGDINMEYFQSIQIQLLYMDPGFIEDDDDREGRLIGLIMAFTLLLKHRMDGFAFTILDYEREKNNLQN